MDDKQNKTPVKKKVGWKKLIFYTFLIAFGLLFAGLTYAHWIIFHDVKEMCTIAQKEFPGDHVEALIAYLESDNHTFKEKNNAIWALGELADSRALPALKKLVTNKECLKPCDNSLYICQYGLKTAIEHCEGKFVAVKWMWRFL
jgi:hypothetical protein